MLDNYKEPGWTTVNYRRGRRRFNRHHQPEVSPRRSEWRSLGPPASGPARNSYASVTGEHSSRSCTTQEDGGLDGDWRLPRSLSPRDPVHYRGNSSMAHHRAPQHRRYAKQQWATHPSEPQHLSDDEHFTTKVRALYRLLKAKHHLDNVSDDGHLPPAIQRITNHLEKVIKPAQPSPKTTNLILDNARLWTQTTMDILKQHYQDEMLTQRVFLLDIGGDLLAPLKIAMKWAKHNLGKRLSSQTVGAVRQYLFMREDRMQSAGVEMKAQNDDVTPTQSSTSRLNQGNPPPTLPPLGVAGLSIILTPPSDHPIIPSAHREKQQQTVNADLDVNNRPKPTVSRSPSTTTSSSSQHGPTFKTTATMTDLSQSSGSPSETGDEGSSTRRHHNMQPSGVPFPQPPPLPQRRRNSTHKSADTHVTGRMTSEAPPPIPSKLSTSATTQDLICSDSFVILSPLPVLPSSLPAPSSSQAPVFEIPPKGSPPISPTFSEICEFYRSKATSRRKLPIRNRLVRRVPKSRLYQ